MKTLPLVLFICSSFCALSQKDGDLYSSSPVTFPLYDSVKDISWYYNKSAYIEAINDKGLSYQKLTYFSDGLRVIAYLITPSASRDKKYPVIIFNRGSFIRNDIVHVHAPLFRKFVQEGFIVIAPALRQSEGGEGKDELGGKEVADILNIKFLLPKIELADTSNIFMLGESRGGMMSFLAIKKGLHVNAAATIGAITDLKVYLETKPWEENSMKKLFADYDKNRDSILKERSVLAWGDPIQIPPILILHGGKDPQVSPEHALNLGRFLTQKGRLYQLSILAEGNHILSGNEIEERDDQVIRWFRKYIR